MGGGGLTPAPSLVGQLAIPSVTKETYALVSGQLPDVRADLSIDCGTLLKALLGMKRALKDVATLTPGQALDVADHLESLLISVVDIFQGKAQGLVFGSSVVVTRRHVIERVPTTEGIPVNQRESFKLAYDGISSCYVKTQEVIEAVNPQELLGRDKSRAILDRIRKVFLHSFEASFIEPNTPNSSESAADGLLKNFAGGALGAALIKGVKSSIQALEEELAASLKELDLPSSAKSDLNDSDIDLRVVQILEETVRDLPHVEALPQLLDVILRIIHQIDTLSEHREGQSVSQLQSEFDTLITPIIRDVARLYFCTLVASPENYPSSDRDRRERPTERDRLRRTVAIKNQQTISGELRKILTDSDDPQIVGEATAVFVRHTTAAYHSQNPWGPDYKALIMAVHGATTSLAANTDECIAAAWPTITDIARRAHRGISALEDTRSRGTASRELRIALNQINRPELAIPLFSD